jgi:hypothetical protein
MNSMVDALAKHLPPSASTLRLLDVNGEAGTGLSRRREDLDVTPVPGRSARWEIPAESVDAIVACNYVLNDTFLAAGLDVLRPGGRLIVANQRGQVTQALGRRLEDAGYVRILVEPMSVEGGVLIRGEKRHTTADTTHRIQQVAGKDEGMLHLESYRGRYVYLLVIQTPNKPVWQLDADEPVHWRAAAIVRDGERTLLGFSSLPRAVGFMQPAVLAGQILDVNKVGKFSKATARSWTLPVLLNPEIDVLNDAQVTWVEIDPASAEMPDE